MRQTVTAGGLRAEVGMDPWLLSFTDADGRPVLAADPRVLPGLRSSTGTWRPATAVRDVERVGDRVIVQLTTDDPTVRRLQLMIAPAAEGVVQLGIRVLGTGEVAATGMSFRASAAERFLGFGERSNAVDQRGNSVENYVADGPYQDMEYPLVESYVPSWGLRPRRDSTYFPVPWLLSTAGYGVLVDNAETSYFHLCVEPDRDTWTVEAATGPEELGLLVFGGPTPADVLRRFTEATGRQPAVAAPWFFGPWVQLTGSDADRTAQLAKLRAEGGALSLVQTYTHYLPNGAHVSVREAERRRVRDLHAAGLAVTTYVNPMIDVRYQPVYDQAARDGALVRRPDGTPYVYRYVDFEVSQVDFATEAGRALYDRLLNEAIADGHDGWMEDFGEYTPLDSVSGDGASRAGTHGHNRYPVEYHRAADAVARKANRPLARFVRSGFTGVAPYAPIVWGGDPTTGWGFDGLASALHAALSMGLSGISMWGSDIGGFFALGANQLTAELLMRWVQLGAVSGVMRTQAEGLAVPPKVRPQVWDDDQLANWRRYAALRTQLYPYLAAADAEYQRTGLPIMRHLALGYPDDETALSCDDEFLFGPDLLVAPVLTPGAVDRTLYLPPGTWVDFWRAVRYDQSAGTVRLGRTETVAGGREITVPAPLDELPLLVRAGAILPLLPPTVTTLYPNPATDVLRLIAFPRGSSAITLDGGERIESRTDEPGWTLTVDGHQHREYELHATFGALRHPFIPNTITMNDRPHTTWSYDEDTGVFDTTFTARRAVLRVTST